MTLFARVEDGLVAVVQDFPVGLEDAVHPDMLAEWVACPSGTKFGDIFDGKSFKSPPIVELPQSPLPSIDPIEKLAAFLRENPDVRAVLDATT